MPPSVTRVVVPGGIRGRTYSSLRSLFPPKARGEERSSRLVWMEIVLDGEKEAERFGRQWIGVGELKRRGVRGMLERGVGRERKSRGSGEAGIIRGGRMWASGRTKTVDSCTGDDFVL